MWMNVHKIVDGVAELRLLIPVSWVGPQETQLIPGPPVALHNAMQQAEAARELCIPCACCSDESLSLNALYFSTLIESNVTSTREKKREKCTLYSTQQCIFSTYMYTTHSTLNVEKFRSPRETQISNLPGHEYPANFHVKRTNILLQFLFHLFSILLDSQTLSSRRGFLKNHYTLETQWENAQDNNLELDDSHNYDGSSSPEP